MIHKMLDKYGGKFPRTITGMQMRGLHDMSYYRGYSDRVTVPWQKDFIRVGADGQRHGKAIRWMQENNINIESFRFTQYAWGNESFFDFWFDDKEDAFRFKIAWG